MSDLNRFVELTAARRLVELEQQAARPHGDEIVSKKNESERLARAWIDGWNAGKPEAIPLATDFSHTSPLGVIKGREKYLAQVKPMAAKNVISLRIVNIVSGDDEAAVWYEVTTPNGLLQACDWVRTENEVIVAITSFYDATHLPHREPYHEGDT